MRRLFGSYAYGPGPRDGCWWDETIAAPDWPEQVGAQKADVVIVGGGFTGMSAALHLAEAGVEVAVLEAGTPGFGASGRSGGFCCLGGAKRSHDSMVAEAGLEATEAYLRAERAAVDLVADLLDRLGIEADLHSKGEVQLAHRPRAMPKMRQEAGRAARLHGVEPRVIEAHDLAAAGLGGAFHGAVHMPIGFGLNPRKYLFGLAAAARAAGARLYQASPALRITETGAGPVVETARGAIRCSQVVLGTNGYSSEDLPPWMAGRYMPTQSTVLVTRPLSAAEMAAQGWTSDLMAYDSRNLLHYFRLMPDRRFLFGMRGELLCSPDAERRARRRVRQDFERLFPAWRHVASPHCWSGFVCLTSRRMPFVGPVPGRKGLFAGFAYHGNGVAMGSYAGFLLAGMVLGGNARVPVPELMQQPPSRFPLGSARRMLMAPAYLGMSLADRF